MLLEQPGEVVLREEIRQRLWPNNTIVEFDHSINAAIQKLRDALGESADQPRYIETVARRGYRFLGEVQKVGEPQPAPAKQPLPVENGSMIRQKTVQRSKQLEEQLIPGRPSHVINVVFIKPDGWTGHSGRFFPGTP